MKIKLLLLVCSISMFIASNAYAVNHPEAHFGEFGIQHFQTLAQYQQNYVGQTVMYIPASNGPSYDDKTEFKGALNSPYTILKITGDNKRITFTLQEVGTKSKIKFVANNQNEYYSYGKYTYCITDKASVPLLLKDKFDQAKKESVGKTINEKYEVVDLIMAASVDENNKYPVAYYVIKNKDNNEQYKFQTDKAKEYCQILGTKYTNDLAKANYTVVNVIQKKSESYPYNQATYYTVKSSISGKTYDVPASTAKTECFKEDLSGHYISILASVEKPSDSSKRYGKTTTVEDKDKGITKYSYIDDIIEILIFGTSKQFSYELKNVGTSSIKVIWNEAAFVDFKGSTSKIMHIGTKYSQKESDQPSTTIIKSAKIEDVAVPIVNVRYSDILKEWVEDSMYPTNVVDKPGQLRLMLPIQVKEVVNEYTFVFDVKYVYDHPELVNF